MTTRHAWPRATAWRSSPPALCVTLFSSLLCLCGGPVAGATSTTAVPSSTPRPGALQDASMRGAFQVCTPENAAVHASFACEMNAGQLMSVPITFGILALFASGVIFSKVARDRSLRPTEEEHAWNDNVQRLLTGLQKGLAVFHEKVSIFLAVYVSVLFVMILLVFSIAKSSDATDGIRLGACFFFGSAAAMVCAWASCSVAVTSVLAAARAARVNEGQHCPKAVTVGGIFAAFFSLGLTLFVLCILYLVMSNGRNKRNISVFGQSCEYYGVMCGRVLAAEAMVAFASGFSTALIVMRVLSGAYYTGSQIGAHILAQINLDSSGQIDRVSNPSTKAVLIGLYAVEVSGANLELIESLVTTMVSAMVLAQGDADRLAMASWMAAWYLPASMVGCGALWRLSRVGHERQHGIDAQSRAMMRAFRLSLLLVFVMVFIFAAIGVGIIYTDYPGTLGGSSVGWRLFACLFIGWLVSFAVIESTWYYTVSSPEKIVASAAVSGTATTMILGFGISLSSIFLPTFACALLLVSCNAVSGAYGICMGTVGFCFPMLVSIAFNSIGPVSVVTDVAVHSGNRLSNLDVAGTLCIAGQHANGIVRGFSAVASTLSSLTVLVVMQQQLGIVSMDGAAFDSIGDPILLGGAVFGAGLPLACSGLNIVAIGSVTSEIVEIIQRELVWLGQIQESKQTDAESEEIHRPDMRELIVGPILASIPGTLWPIAATVVMPLLVGFWMGPRVLMAFVAGSIFGGGVFALFCQNLGTLWRNVKTTVAVDDSYGGPSSSAYSSCNTADMVSGPLKDCASPLCLSLTKGMALVSLLIAPLIRIDLNRSSVQECLAKSQAQRLSCFDWNKAYWGIFPSLFFFGVTTYSYLRFWRKVVSEPVEKYEKDVGIDREENMFETLKATISDLSQTSRSGSPHNISIDAERTQQVQGHTQPLEQGHTIHQTPLLQGTIPPAFLHGPPTLMPIPEGHLSLVAPSAVPAVPIHQHPFTLANPTQQLAVRYDVPMSNLLGNGYQITSAETPIAVGPFAQAVGPFYVENENKSHTPPAPPPKI